MLDKELDVFSHVAVDFDFVFGCGFWKVIEDSKWQENYSLISEWLVLIVELSFVNRYSKMSLSWTNPRSISGSGLALLMKKWIKYI